MKFKVIKSNITVASEVAQEYGTSIGLPFVTSNAYKDDKCLEADTFQFTLSDTETGAEESRLFVDGASTLTFGTCVTPAIKTKLYNDNDLIVTGKKATVKTMQIGVQVSECGECTVLI